MARLGTYELLTRLAVGGMAEIYAARSRDAADRIAIVKQMLPQYAGNPAYVDMFLDEGRVVALLKHPNIVELHDFGFEGDQPYLAMEYLHGVDVRTILRTMYAARQVVPLPVALAIVQAISAGLHHAHEALTSDGEPMELVHRDVSPQNIVVTFAGVTKLIDFGIAERRGRIHEPRGGSLEGKVAYMSPEQIRGHELDRRTDVYAAGVVLYELLTGRRPYRISGSAAEQQGEFSLMMAIAGHEIVPPTRFRPDLPRNVERVVLGAIAQDAADRFATAAALGGAIREVVRELGLGAGERPVAEFLAQTFGDRDREWCVLRGLPDEDLVTHIHALEHIKTAVGAAFEPELDDDRSYAAGVRAFLDRSVPPAARTAIDELALAAQHGGPLDKTVASSSSAPSALRRQVPTAAARPRAGLRRLIVLVLLALGLAAGAAYLM